MTQKLSDCLFGFGTTFQFKSINFLMMSLQHSFFASVKAHIWKIQKTNIFY